MVKSRDMDRFGALVRAAIQVFIRNGYRLTQMSDVAREAGMAKGTLYLYVTSKEALFDLAIRHADGVEPLATPAELPVAAPDGGATLAEVQRRLSEATRLPLLRGAILRDTVPDPILEFEAVAGEFYDLLYAQRTSLKLVDRCAKSYPALGAIFFQMARVEVPELLCRYLAIRAQHGQLRRCPNPEMAVRSWVETCAFWAVHVHWDESTPETDPARARETALGFLTGAFRHV